MSKKNRVPKYALHKATGQARVRWRGRDHYLGPFNSPVSKQRYRRLVERWQLELRASEFPELTVADLCLLYLEFARVYYVKDGVQTSEVHCIRPALRSLVHLFRNLPLAEFSPSKLRRIREQFIEAGLARYTVNKQVGRIVRMFSWAVSQEYCSPQVVVALREVPGLKAGRTAAREAVPVRPVELAAVQALHSFITRELWGAIRFQLATACRPGEALQLRWCDLDQNEEVRTYLPSSHKTAHHGKSRQILVGPLAREVLEAFPLKEPEDYIFCVPGSEGKRKYQRTSYTRAVHRACRKAGIPVWKPNQLRHTAATKIRKLADLETAKTILGHSELRITEIYAERDLEKARQVISRIG